MHVRPSRIAGSVPILLALVLPAAAQEPAAQESVAYEEAARATDEVPLYDNLGSHHLAISTEVPLAQRYFDQGLRLEYAFNHAEAIRAYEAALAHDPRCAMCAWGVALASGPNINAPLDSAGSVTAFRALLRAVEAAERGGATEREAEFMEALAARHGGMERVRAARTDPAVLAAFEADPLADRAGRDSAFAEAMGTLAARYPDDPEALTLYAAAVMNLSPWHYWEGDYGDRVPRPGTEEVLASLERAMELDRDHPGACHYYIHAVEAAHPEKAVPCADRLASLMPGAGHLVHMPGHIYIRVGRYADAVRANEHAVHSDETYIQDQNPRGIYPMAYYPHNYHFMNFAATMAGMSAKARDAAAEVAPRVPVEVAEQVAFIQNAVVLPQLTAVNFGRWDDVLGAPAPDARLNNAVALHHYARGTALAALDRLEEARAELEAVRRLAEERGAHGPDAVGTPEVVIAIAEHALAGEISHRAGDASEAVTHFEKAAELEDGMRYEEPPLWYYPVRHSLGRAYLEAGRPADARRAYEEDLLRFPGNGWALYGLALSLEALGDRAAADDARQRFREAWRSADVELSASRF